MSELFKGFHSGGILTEEIMSDFAGEFAMQYRHDDTGSLSKRVRCISLKLQTVSLDSSERSS